MIHNTKTLVLDKCYSPMEIYSWEDAFTAWASGRADIVETYSEVVHSGHDKSGVVHEYLIPSVIRMHDAVVNYKKMGLVRPLSRNALYEEYNGKCVYCGKSLSHSEMTLDHVIPKSKSGSHSWGNLVASCFSCNAKKRDRTPSEAGMKLLQPIKIPRMTDLVPYAILRKMGATIPHETWRPYMRWERDGDE